MTFLDNFNIQNEKLPVMYFQRLQRFNLKVATKQTSNLYMENDPLDTIVTGFVTILTFK